MITFFPLWFWDKNSANVCPCVTLTTLTCRKSRLIKGYELSYATGSLNGLSSCIPWGVGVWTVGHWAVRVQVIYCSIGGCVLFLKKNQRHPWEEFLSCSNSRKPDLPVTQPLPSSTWLSVLSLFSLLFLYFFIPFFLFPAKTTLLGQGYGFCWWRR